MQFHPFATAPLAWCFSGTRSKAVVYSFESRVPKYRFQHNHLFAFCMATRFCRSRAKTFKCRARLVIDRCSRYAQMARLIFGDSTNLCYQIGVLSTQKAENRVSLIFDWSRNYTQSDWRRITCGILFSNCAPMHTLFHLQTTTIGRRVAVVAVAR